MSSRILLCYLNDSNWTRNYHKRKASVPPFWCGISSWHLKLQDTVVSDPQPVSSLLAVTEYNTFKPADFKPADFKLAISALYSHVISKADSRTFSQTSMVDMHWLQSGPLTQ